MVSIMREVKDDLLFGESNSYLELAIISELENEEQYHSIIRKTMEFVNQMYIQAKKDTDYLDFVIHFKNLSHVAEDSSVTLELHIGEVSGNTDINTLTLEEYVRHIRFRILDEFDGFTYHNSFRFTARGLLEAMVEFNRLAN